MKTLCARHQVDLYVPLVGTLDEKALRATEDFPSTVHLLKGHDPWSRAARLRQLLQPVPFGLSQWAPKRAVAEAKALLGARVYDLLYVDELFLAPYAWNSPTPKLLARNKIELQYYTSLLRWAPTIKERLLYLIELPKILRLETKAWRTYPAGIVCSEADRNLVLKMNRSVDLLVAPNGVDIEHFRLKPLEDDPKPRLLLMGDMEYPPNVDGVLHFFRDIYPLLHSVANLQVRIVGHNPPPQVQRLGQLPGITVTGSVPDVRPYLEEATVLLVPLRIGGGTRLKIPEAWAAGRPVVSTSIGSQGLEARDGENILLADDSSSFAQKTMMALGNRELRQQLTAKARELAERRYSWATISSQIEWFCTAVAEKGKR